MKKTTESRIRAMLRGSFPVYEFAAFQYELVRRHKPTRKAPVFTKLSRMDVDMVQQHFQHTGEKWVVSYHSSPLPRFDSGVCFDGVEWNLKASDASLVRAFTDLVRTERKERGIQKPAKNEGNRNRPISWNWIEFMDHPKHLDESARSHLSQARKRAAELYPVLLEVVRQIARGRNYFKQHRSRGVTDYVSKPYVCRP